MRPNVPLFQFTTDAVYIDIRSSLAGARHEIKGQASFRYNSSSQD
jgi:hypothetical protein